MITTETFDAVRQKFGHYASWAVWADQTTTPKSNIDDLSIFEPNKNPNLLKTLNAEFIFLGLNISRRIERPLGNFHDPRPMATDYKIRYAIRDSIYWGGYMTDIIKDFEEKASGKMVKFLRGNPEFEKENIGILRKEIDVLGCKDPLLIAFGKDAEVISRRNLGKEFRICSIPHYANYSAKDTYRAQVLNILDEHATDRQSASLICSEVFNQKSKNGA
jgi:hypothetical protein